jgi:hypothetical protein
MNDQAHHYRCDERAFAFDLTNSIKRQLRRAIDNPDDQWDATIDASRVVPVLRARLVPEHEGLWTELPLLFDNYLDGSGQDLADKTWHC